MKTLGDVILGSMEDLINHKVIPEFKCRHCNIHYVFEPDDFCDFCINEIINNEGD